MFLFPLFQIPDLLCALTECLGFQLKHGHQIHPAQTHVDLCFELWKSVDWSNNGKFTCVDFKRPSVPNCLSFEDIHCARLHSQKRLSRSGLSSRSPKLFTVGGWKCVNHPWSRFGPSSTGLISPPHGYCKHITQFKPRMLRQRLTSCMCNWRTDSQSRLWPGCSDCRLRLWMCKNRNTKCGADH